MLYDIIKQYDIIRVLAFLALFFYDFVYDIIYDIDTFPMKL